MTEIDINGPRERKKLLGGCGRFKQNAWKKELCSNCYKPKDEHQITPRRNTYSLLLPLISVPPLRSPSQGILKGHGAPRQRNRKNVSVTFHEKESQIIGFGGAEDDSSGGEDSDQDDFGGEDGGGDVGSGATSPEEDVEEERALKLLTKTNTDFNSVLDNLSGSKPPTAPLLLGHCQQKQKLTVTVQPFGSSGRNREQLLDSLLLTTVAAVRQETACNVTTTPQSPTLLPEPNHDTDEGKTSEAEISPEDDSGSAPDCKDDGCGTRANPEGRKVQITRGTVITKQSHEHKLYIQNVIQSKNETKRNKEVTSVDFNKTVIVTGQFKEKEPASPTSPKEEFLKSVLAESSGEVTVKVLKLLNGEEGPAESREMAGEPDGKASDSDEQETPPSPSLPPVITPPPRTSFLHREANNSSTILLNEGKRPSQEVASSEPSTCRSIKRPAPKPPASPESAPAAQPPSIQVAMPADRSPDADKLELRPRTHSLELTPPRRELPPLPMTPIREPPLLPTTPIREFLPTPVQDTPERESPRYIPPTRSDTPVDRKKGSGRMKVTLKKLLRLGSGMARDEDWSPRCTSESEQTPLPPTRPRPLIVHPLDLNKSAVQVLPPSTPVSEKSPESPTSPVGSPSTILAGRPTKPPPPPRSESLNLMERLRNSTNMDNIYANLVGAGESRLGMSPFKPQRTGSLREAKNHHQIGVTISSSAYSIDNGNSTTSSSQLEESNSENDTETSANPSEQCGLEDDTSITYYGSETESDIYCSNSALHMESKNKPMKTGRFSNSILRDSYSAIITSNYKSLVHLFNKIMHTKEEVPEIFKVHSTLLRWSDFIIPEPCGTKYVNGVSVYSAEFKSHPVTLFVSQQDFDLPESIGPVYAKFRDTLPSYICSVAEFNNSLPVAISVLKKATIETVSEFNIKSERKVGGLILLQIIQYIVNNMNSNGKTYSIRDFAIVLRGNAAPIVCYIPVKEVGARKSIEECISDAARLLVGEESPIGKILIKAKVPDQETVQLLQYVLWGPPSSTSCEEMKMWLDIERANLLQEIVCSSSFQNAHNERLNFIIGTDAQRLAVLSAQLNTIVNK